MATAILRPNATDTAGGYTATGAASLHAATNDDSDSSYMSASAATGNTILDLGTTTIPTGAQVRSVTVRYRISQTSGTKYFRCELRSAGKNSGEASVKATSTITTYSGSARKSDPAGNEWTQTTIDSLQIRCRITGDVASGNYRVYELYADVLYNERPVATVTAPSEGGTSTTRTPTVSWTYSDPENDDQERYRVKIFSSAQYGAGGFDPDTSTATWDSGEVFSEATSKVVGTNLTDGTTYRAYVKVADEGSNGRYSAWDYNQFTVSLPGSSKPATPTMGTAIWTSSNARTAVGLTWTKGSTTPQIARIVVQYSTDGGTNWSTGRGAVSVSGTPFTGTFYDYEGPPGVATKYRARGETAASTAVSNYSTQRTVSPTPSLSAWWLKDPNASTANMTVRVRTPLQRQITETEAVFRPLGRTRAVVVADRVQGEDGTLTIVSTNSTKWTQLRRLLARSASLLLQSPLEDQYYIRVSDARQFTVTGTTGRPVRETQIPFVEVDRPSS